MEELDYHHLPSAETSHSKCGNTKYIVLLTTSAVIGSFLFGYDTGIIGAANIYLEDEWDLSPMEIGVIVSITIAGAIVGALISAPIADSQGRKLSIYLADLFFIFGSVMMALAPNSPVMIAGRLVVGIGVGMAAMIAPVYLTETAPANLRGGIVGQTMVFVTGGQFIAYLIGITLGDQWRWMLGLGAVPPVIQLFSMLFLPESPRYYVKIGKIEQAEKVLMKLRIPSNKPANPWIIAEELQEIQQSLTSELKTGFFSNTKLLFKTHRQQAITGIGLLGLQQFVGINCAMYYGPQLMQLAGFQNAKYSAIIASLPIAAVNFAGSIVSVFIIDRIGRRGILLWSLPGAFVSLVGIGASFGLLEFQKISYGQWAILIFILVYIACFSIGMGVAPWVIVSEIVPLQLRSTAASLATAANWLSNFAVSMSFLSIASTPIGMIAIWVILALFAMFTFIWVYVRLPETRGRHLEEITSLFQKEHKTK